MPKKNKNSKKSALSPDKQVIDKPKRDAHGRLLPGSTANRYGRPKGNECLGPIMRNLMPQLCTMKTAKGKLLFPGKTWAEVIAISTMENAILGNTSALREVWERSDGKVALPITAAEEDLTIVISNRYRPDIKSADSDKAATKRKNR